jgi:glycosyltransferase involved in cell wall biosynthesis
VLTAPLLVWGTYDTTKPRVRLLLEGLRAAGIAHDEAHADIWTGVRDKGTLTRREQLAAAWRWCRAQPALVAAFLRAPTPRAVLVPYLGLFDLLVLAPFARWRRVPIIWDLFLSPWDTVVHDRGMVGRWHPVAILLYASEWLASRLATRLFLDTAAHARRYEGLMGLPEGRVGAVPLGTDPARFPARPARPAVHKPLRVLFYGQYIPLHGLGTIVRAAKLLDERGAAVRITLVGGGQEEPRIRALIAELGVGVVEQRGWVPVEELPALIHDADVGLGIFGTSGKAVTVVPNKVYELAATQTPIVTGDTPAMREFAPGHPWVLRVPPGDPAALAACLEGIVATGGWPEAPPLPVVGPREVGAAFAHVAEGLL